MCKELTEQDHPIHSSLLHLLHELSEVRVCLLHIGGEDGEVGAEVCLQVGGPVLGVSGGVHHSPDVHSGVTQGQGLEVKNLHCLRRS